MNCCETGHVLIICLWGRQILSSLERENSLDIIHVLTIYYDAIDIIIK